MASIRATIEALQATLNKVPVYFDPRDLETHVPILAPRTSLMVKTQQATAQCRKTGQPVSIEYNIGGYQARATFSLVNGIVEHVTEIDHPDKATRKQLAKAPLPNGMKAKRWSASR